MRYIKLLGIAVAIAVCIVAYFTGNRTNRWSCRAGLQD